MSRSIEDSSGVCLVAETPPAVVSLDINRETRAGRVSPEKKTAKKTPIRSWTPEEKASWQRERLLETETRSRSALRIVSKYVNDISITEEEKAARLAVFGSFLKCRRRHNGPAELLLTTEKKGDRLALGGVWRCRSKWACPDCAGRLLLGDARRIRALLEAVARESRERREKGLPPYAVLFLTLTGPHRAGESLREHMSALSSAFGSTFHCRPVRRLRERFGFVGSVRCFDHTVSLTEEGRNWHAHLHVLLVFETADLFDGSSGLAELETALFEAWADYLAAEYEDDRRASAKAFALEVVDLGEGERESGALADYASKVAALPGYLTKSAKDREGEGALRRGLAPYDLLDLYADCGGEEYAAAWLEYVSGTKGFHRVDFSSGLAGRFGVVEDAPAVSARFVLPPAVAAVAVARPVFLADLKRFVLAGSVEGVEAVLAVYGLPVEFAGEVLEKLPLREHVLTETELLKARRFVSRGDAEGLRKLLGEQYGEHDGEQIGEGTAAREVAEVEESTPPS